MHGAILKGFLSRFVGMALPGARSTELSVGIQFLNPCYSGAPIRLQGVIAQRMEILQVVVMPIKYPNLTRRVTLAPGRVRVRVRVGLAVVATPASD